MSDGYVQVLPDNTGKLIDTTELTVDGNTVERQRMVLADSADASSLAIVTADGALTVTGNHVDTSMQLQIVGQLKRIAMLLQILVDTEISVADAW